MNEQEKRDYLEGREMKVHRVSENIPREYENGENK